MAFTHLFTDIGPVNYGAKTWQIGIFSMGKRAFSIISGNSTLETW